MYTLFLVCLEGWSGGGGRQAMRMTALPIYLYLLLRFYLTDLDFVANKIKSFGAARNVQFSVGKIQRK
jgi:hypothetical protein